MKVIIFSDQQRPHIFVTRKAASMLHDDYGLPIMTNQTEPLFVIGTLPTNPEDPKNIISQPHIQKINNDLRPYGRQETLYHIGGPDIRTHSGVIATAESLGEDFMRDGEFKIVNVPDDVEWFIDINPFRIEIVREKHRSWGFKES